jgi:hypothetical protein
MTRPSSSPRRGFVARSPGRNPRRSPPRQQLRRERFLVPRRARVPERRVRPRGAKTPRTCARCSARPPCIASSHRPAPARPRPCFSAAPRRSWARARLEKKRVQAGGGPTFSSAPRLRLAAPRGRLPATTATRRTSSADPYCARGTRTRRAPPARRRRRRRRRRTSRARSARSPRCGAWPAFRRTFRHRRNALFSPVFSEKQTPFP